MLPWYSNHGTRQKCLIKESRKKRKKCNGKERGKMKWICFDGPNYHIKENSELLPADLVEAMKRMNPPPIFSSQKKCKHKDGNAN